MGVKLARMIERHAKRRILRSLADAPAVALLGPRQVGKTTLARHIAADAPFGTDAYFYRTRTGAELDLLLLLPNRELWAVEVKRNATPRIGKGFALAAEDVQATERFVVHSGDDSFPLSQNTLAIPLAALMKRLAALD